MPNLIVTKHRGEDCYVIDAHLVKDGARTMRVSIEGKPYFLPKVHAEFVSTGRCAIKIELYDALFNQDKFKKTVMVKASFVRNMGHVPVPKLRKFSKN